MSDIDGSGRDLGVTAAVSLGLLALLLACALPGMSFAGLVQRAVSRKLRTMTWRRGLLLGLCAPAIAAAVLALAVVSLRHVSGGKAVCVAALIMATLGFLAAIPWLGNGSTPTSVAVGWTAGTVVVVVTLIAVTNDFWESTPRVALAIRAGLPRPSTLYFEHTDVAVKIEPRDKDPLKLCGSTATATLVARGRGYAYVVLRPAGMPSGALAPVVPIPEADYVVYTASSQSGRGQPTNVCAAPLP